MIAKLRYFVPSTVLVNIYNSKPVTFLYYEAVSKLMFNVHNQSAPINILKLFTKYLIFIQYLQYSIIQIPALKYKVL